MIYHQRNRKNKKTWYKYLILIIIVLLLIFFLGSPIRSSINFLIPSITSFSQTIFSPFHNVTAYFNSKQSLSNEKKDLEKKLEEIEIELLNYNLLKKENQELKSKLNRYDISDLDNLTLAEVLIYQLPAEFDTLTIDLGSDTVKTGLEVFSSDIYLGEVSETYKKTSVVRVISTPSMETKVKIGDKFEGQAVGQGGGDLVLEVPKDLQIAVGEVVVLAESGKVIGAIQSIEVSPVSTFKKVFFSFPFNLSEIDFVEVDLDS